MNIKSEHNSSGDWEACRPGEIGGLTQRLGARRRRRAIVSGIMSAAVVVGVVGLGVVGTNLLDQTAHRHDGLTCEQVADLLVRYERDELEPEKMREVAVHLDRCEKCRVHREEMLHASLSPARKAIVVAGPSATWPRHSH